MNPTIGSQATTAQRRPGAAIGGPRPHVERARTLAAAIALGAALLAGVAGAVLDGVRTPDPAAPVAYPRPGGPAELFDRDPNAQAGLDIVDIIAR